MKCKWKGWNVLKVSATMFILNFSEYKKKKYVSIGEGSQRDDCKWMNFQGRGKRSHTTRSANLYLNANWGGGGNTVSYPCLHYFAILKSMEVSLLWKIGFLQICDAILQLYLIKTKPKKSFNNGT